MQINNSKTPNTAERRFFYYLLEADVDSNMNEIQLLTEYS